MTCQEMIDFLLAYVDEELALEQPGFVPVIVQRGCRQL